MTDRRDDAATGADPGGADPGADPVGADPGADPVGADPRAAPQAAPTPPGEPVQLDEVMLAMDVVDTLRHRETLIAKELAEGAREEDMVARLRQVYAAQGIEVPDRILREGVDALKENRFVYTPEGSPGARRWALLWVRRGRVAAVLLGLVVLVAAGLYAYDAAVRAPRRNLVSDLATTRAAIVALSEEPAVTGEANDLYRQAEIALNRGDQG